MIAERLAATDPEFDTIATNLTRVLVLAADLHRVYRYASSIARRQFNQAIFTAIYLHDEPDGPIATDLAEPFATLLTLDVADAPAHADNAPDTVHRQPDTVLRARGPRRPAHAGRPTPAARPPHPRAQRANPHGLQAVRV
ncbi:MAG TPA: hypothetical protein VIS06_22850 [Mycobacteriales bacterium]